MLRKEYIDRNLKVQFKKNTWFFNILTEILL